MPSNWPTVYIVKRKISNKQTFPTIITYRFCKKNDAVLIMESLFIKLTIIITLFSVPMYLHVCINVEAE